ncbi:pterin-4-alpha-carbinolamine dehydratase [Pedobacter sp. BS3]|uniref:4a-hydroxytetrahydrobiopterin dehydratase n=1 Tax=Pedobacter sp. BS3 TaxID=2567937 RepID=UPI0011ED6F5C|nr:4a-hydroxytetrahydrobiopterin dehydratase [Pedobacter sp. BS3]TZF83757.1 pterin-4-alpha-carbinolamine dehydratase [Pedobacter sp. BS3]
MWQQIDNKLYREFLFADFPEAFAFMTRVALLAEKHQHHPQWTNVWNKVEIWLYTHDEGRISEKDEQLASEIDQLLTGQSK